VRKRRQCSSSQRSGVDLSSFLSALSALSGWLEKRNLGSAYFVLKEQFDDYKTNSLEIQKLLMKQAADLEERNNHLLNCLLQAKGSPPVGWKPQQRPPIKQESGFQAATRIAVEQRMAEHAQRTAYYAEQARQRQAQAGTNGNASHTPIDDEDEEDQDSQSDLD
jgi:hypothetical protein